MARKPRAKPKTPQEIQAEKLETRRKDMEAVNVQSDAAYLPSQEDIQVTRAGEGRGAQTAKHDSARRLDAFEALRDTMAPGCYDAGRKLEADIQARLGITDRGQASERVDCTAGFTTDAMVAAAERVEAVTAHLSVRDHWLLYCLIVPLGGKTWREVVAYVTGEENPNSQGAAVRAATVNLRDAYVAIERRAAA